MMGDIMNKRQKKKLAKKAQISKLVTNDYEVMTPTGWSNFSGIRRKMNFVYKIQLETCSITATIDHPFSVLIKGKEITSRLMNLNIGDRLQTKNGFESIISITKIKNPQWTYDLLDVEKNAMFYANGVVSHNCFLETGQSAVDGDLIQEYRERAKQPKYVFEDGHYKIWDDPQAGRLYVMGVDVGEGVGQAASVVQVFDVTDLTNIIQVACYHNNAIDPFHFASLLYKMTNQWGRPQLLIERNNCGGQVIDALKEVHNYHNIVDYTPENQKGYSRLGIYCHTNAKFQGVMNMRYWINSLRVVALQDIATIQELETFVKYPNGTWKKKRGDYIYDDRVMSMMWALFALKTEVCEKYFEITQYDDQGKPAKINPFNVESDKFFGLTDNLYKEDDAPLPTFIGNITPNSQKLDDQEDIQDLLNRGWSFKI